MGKKKGRNKGRKTGINVEEEINIEGKTGGSKEVKE